MNREPIPEALQGAPSVQRVELAEFSASAPGPSAAAALESIHPLHGVKTRVQVCVGEAEITVGELLRARQHELLVLDRTPEEPVELLLDGRVIARGQLVAVDGRFAVRISELPTSLKLGEAA